jgi:NAD+ diphosphatase
MQTAEIQASALFDRAADKREDLAFLEAALSDPKTLFLPFWRGQILLRGKWPALIEQAEAPQLVDQSSEVVWLGRYDERPCFGLDISALAAPSQATGLAECAPSELRTLLSRLNAAQTELAMTARALLLWHERHRFCSVCGRPSRALRGGHVRTCTESQCNAEHFPRTDPCVLVLIVDGDRCLLGRSKGWPAGMYSALAGFVEPGETLEQAVAREVMEEVGVTVSDLRYSGSQPWAFPASLMVGFVATATSTEIRIDEHEIEAARWVTRAELQDPAAHGFFVPPTSAIAGQLIRAFAQNTLNAALT